MELVYIGKLVHPVEGEGVNGEWGIVILASWEYYFIRLLENLVQHPSNNISIVNTDTTCTQKNASNQICLRVGKVLEQT